MKRSLLILFSVLLILLTIVVPIGAANNSYQEGTSYEVIHPFLDTINVSMDFYEDGSPSRTYLTFDVDTSVVKFSDTGSQKVVYSPNVDIVLDGSVPTVLDPGSLNQTVTYEYDDVSSEMHLALPFNSSLSNAASETQVNMRFTFLGADDYEFVTMSDLYNYFLVSGGIGSDASDLERSISETGITINYITKNVLADGSKAYENWSKTFVSNTTSGLLSQIQDFMSNGLNSSLTVSNIVGVSNYYYNISFFTTNGNGALDGEVIFDLSYLGSNYTLDNYVGQGFFGKNTVETVYNNSLDISGVFNSVKTALSVDFIGPISFLDILTIFVALSITVWILKLFAGG